MKPPGVGIGVIVENTQGQILILKRLGSHAAKYSIPGGHLEPGETFEQAAVRELAEETGLTIRNPQVIAVTNNLETFREEGVHYISVILLAKDFSGKPEIKEPHKCSGLDWYDPRDLPAPHFDASRLGIRCYLTGSFYKAI